MNKIILRKASDFKMHDVKRPWTISVIEYSAFKQGMIIRDYMATLNDLTECIFCSLDAV